MTTNNRILTVSYGTFSCTLEGFDDSVETMKQITDYFREISASDPIFGAEAMLAETEVLEQIAQQNHDGPVEARLDDGQVVVSALESEETYEDENSDVLKAAAAGAAIAAVAELGNEIVPSVPDEEVSAFFAKGQSDDADEPLEDAVADLEDDQQDGLSSEEELEELADDVGEELEDTDLTSDLEDVLGDLQNTDEEPEAEVFDLMDDASDEPAETVETDEAASLEDDQPEDQDNELAALLGSLRDEDPEDDLVGAEETLEDHGEEETIFAEDDVEAFESDEEDDDNLLDDLLGMDEDEEEEPLILTDAIEPEPAEPTPHARATRVNPDDLDAAIERGNLVAEEPAQEEEPPIDSEERIKSAITALSVERAKKRRTTSVLRNIDDENNPDVQRLMDMTEDQMGEPESTTRRDAFAQLKAAVAAKKADDDSDDRSIFDEVKDDDAYRADLADADLPEAPEPKKAERKRTAEAPSSPSPLKLVAEQRVEEEAAPEPVQQPAAATAEAAEDGSFAEFVEEMEAFEVAELVEAGAAYLTFVQGNEQFSRPQLMSLVKSIMQEELSREEGLRCFGKLLRDGKIEKVRGGRFQVSDEISFKPDTRAAS